jgi:hypothetical protein
VGQNAASGSVPAAPAPVKPAEPARHSNEPQVLTLSREIKVRAAFQSIL